MTASLCLIWTVPMLEAVKHCNSCVLASIFASFAGARVLMQK